MPTAALDDIHGNLQALDAVLADPRFTAADQEHEWYGWVRDRLGPERLATVASWPLSFAIEVGGLSAVHCPRAYWALLGPDVELVRTDFDVETAAAAVLASGQPNAEEGRRDAAPAAPAEVATAHWEATRLQQ